MIHMKMNESIAEVMHKNKQNIKKQIIFVSSDYFLQGELQDFFKNSEYIFTSCLEDPNVCERKSESFAFLLHFKDNKTFSEKLFKIKQKYPDTPIIAISNNEYPFDSLLIETPLLYGVIENISKNKNLLSNTLKNAMSQYLSNSLFRKSAFFLEDYISRIKNQNINNIDTLIDDVIFQLDAFSGEKDSSINNVEFIAFNRFDGKVDILGGSGSFRIIKNKMNQTIPKDIQKILNETYIMEDNCIFDNYESFYFKDNYNNETVFIFKNLNNLMFVSSRLFNLILVNTVSILHKLYYLDKKEKEHLDNLIIINEVLNGKSFEKEVEILNQLMIDFNLLDFQKNELFYIFNIFGLENRLKDLNNNKSVVLKTEFHSTLKLANNIYDEIINYVPIEHTEDNPTIYKDLIYVTDLIFNFGIKKLLSDSVLLPKYVKKVLSENKKNYL